MSNNMTTSKEKVVTGNMKKSLLPHRRSEDAFVANLDQLESEERQRSFRDAISNLKPTDSSATSNSTLAESLEDVDDVLDKDDKKVLLAEQLSSARRVLNYRNEKHAIVDALQQQETADRCPASRVNNNTTSSFHAEKVAIIAVLQPPNADAAAASAAIPPPFAARSNSERLPSYLRHEKSSLARENSDKVVPGAYRAGGQPVGQPPALDQRPNTTSSARVVLAEPEPEEVPRDSDPEALTQDIPTEHLEEKPFWSQPRWILVGIGVLLLSAGTGAGLGIGLSGESSVVPSAKCIIPQAIHNECLETGTMVTPLPVCAMNNYWALRETFVPTVLSDFSQDAASCAPINLSLWSLSTELDLPEAAKLNRLVLGAFYYNGGDWSAISWFTNQDPCEWIGINCNGNGEITSIRLSSKRLEKQIPTEFGLLPFLGTFVSILFTNLSCLPWHYFAHHSSTIQNRDDRSIL
jgi:hypothetical protein